MPRILLIGLLLAMLALPPGCGGKPATDWQSRVGAYTFADAEREYGKPNGKQDLSDDRVMYLWYDQRGSGWKNVLSLIFDSSGKLLAVDRNQR